METIKDLIDIRPGYVLFSTCGQSVFGIIVDYNKEKETISFVNYDISEILNTSDSDDDYILNENLIGKWCFVKDMKIKDFYEVKNCHTRQFGIALDVPWFGCYRCVESFWIMKDQAMKHPTWEVGNPLPDDWAKYGILL